ncbi:MAG TPA: hypothetical protein VJI13_05810 [Candidatus Norongarragalinales archaeon]|nr:hypothetical protein [Candidatus Norongarragalinales archaeon]
MKEKDVEMDWQHGWWCRKSRFGFGLWVGLFLLIWGLFEIAREFGWIKAAAFPFWPLLLIVIGLSMVLHRI